MPNPNNNLTNEAVGNNETNREITFLDVENFIIYSWKLIFSMGLIGLIGGGIFLLLVPKQYEAIAQVQLSQFGVKDTLSENFITPGVSVEDVGVLIARLKMPSTFTNLEKEQCGLNYKDESIETFGESLKIIPIKSPAQVVEIKVKRSSSSLALLCLKSIFQRIRETQDEIKEPFINKARLKIAANKNKLDSLKSFLDKVDKSIVSSNVGYLSILDEIRSIKHENADLEDFIAGSELRQAKLISPLYVSDVPIFPRKFPVMFFSLLIGLSVGFILALVIKSRAFDNKKYRGN